MSKTKSEKGNASFEASLQRLEEIVENLEHGDVALDDTLKQFEEGMKLVRSCHAKLDEAEKKLKILVEDKEGGFTLTDEPE